MREARPNFSHNTNRDTLEKESLVTVIVMSHRMERNGNATLITIL